MNFKIFYDTVGSQVASFMFKFFFFSPNLSFLNDYVDVHNATYITLFFQSQMIQACIYVCWPVYRAGKTKKVPSLSAPIVF